MRTIGIRELRQRASEYLRLVEAGETVEVTDRGRPVARLVPIPNEDPIRRLRNQGRLSEVSEDLLELWPPLEPDRAATTPTEALTRARAKER